MAIQMSRARIAPLAAFNVGLEYAIELGFAHRVLHLRSRLIARWLGRLAVREGHRFIRVHAADGGVERCHGEGPDQEEKVSEILATVAWVVKRK